MSNLFGFPQGLSGGSKETEYNTLYPTNHVTTYNTNYVTDHGTSHTTTLGTFQGTSRTTTYPTDLSTAVSQSTAWNTSHSTASYSTPSFSGSWIEGNSGIRYRTDARIYVFHYTSTSNSNSTTFQYMAGNGTAQYPGQSIGIPSMSPNTGRAYLFIWKYSTSHNSYSQAYVVSLGSFTSQGGSTQGANIQSIMNQVAWRYGFFVSNATVGTTTQNPVVYDGIPWYGTIGNNPMSDTWGWSGSNTSFWNNPSPGYSMNGCMYRTFYAWYGTSSNYNTSYSTSQITNFNRLTQINTSHTTTYATNWDTTLPTNYNTSYPTAYSTNHTTNYNTNYTTSHITYG